MNRTAPRNSPIEPPFYCDPLATARALRSWFFQEGDAAGAAALRIGFGLLGLFNLWDFYPVMGLMFGKSGLYGTLDPGRFNLADPRNLLFRFDSPFALQLWFWASVAVLLCVVAGLFTRYALAAAYFSMVLFQHRDPYMVYGADAVMSTCGLWLLFLDCGKAYSVDRLISGKPGPEKSGVIPLWPVQAIQVQVAMIYLVTSLAKLPTEPWQEGSAVYYVLQQKGYISDIFPAIIQHKLLLSLMNYGSLAIELSFPVLVFLRPTRLLALCLGFAMHAGIDVFMSIRLFSMAMYWSYLSFLTPLEAKILLGMPGRIMRRFYSLGGVKWQANKP